MLSVRLRPFIQRAAVWLMGVFGVLGVFGVFGGEVVLVGGLFLVLLVLVLLLVLTPALLSSVDNLGNDSFGSLWDKWSEVMNACLAGEAREDVLKLSLEVLRRVNEDTLAARRWMAFVRFGGSAADSVDALVIRGCDVEETDSLRGAGAAGGHDGTSVGAGAQRSLNEVPAGMLEKDVNGGCVRTGEPRAGMSMILGLPAGLNEMVLTTISFSEFMLEDRDDRDWRASLSLAGPGPNSTRESASSPEREPSSSLDRYHSWGSGDEPFSSVGVLSSRSCSSIMTLSSMLETRRWLLWGRAGGWPAAGRVRIWVSISLSTSRSS